MIKAQYFDVKNMWLYCVASLIYQPVKTYLNLAGLLLFLQDCLFNQDGKFYLIVPKEKVGKYFSFQKIQNYYYNF